MQQIAPKALQAKLDEGAVKHLYDVRPDPERAMALIEAAVQLTDEVVWFQTGLEGPLQSYTEFFVEQAKTRAGTTLLEDLDSYAFFSQLQPTGKLKVSAYVRWGDAPAVSLALAALVAVTVIRRLRRREAA